VVAGRIEHNELLCPSLEDPDPPLPVHPERLNVSTVPAQPVRGGRESAVQAKEISVSKAAACPILPILELSDDASADAP